MSKDIKNRNTSLQFFRIKLQFKIKKNGDSKT